MDQESLEKFKQTASLNSAPNRWRAWGFVCGIALLLFIALNFSYFWAQIKFTVQKPKVLSPISGSEKLMPQTEQENSVQQPKSSQKISGTVEDDKQALIYASGSLQIPSLGINAPVVYVDQAKEKVFQEALINGVVHFPGTANPGEVGNDYIFGHSSDYLFSRGQYKTVFALLPRIEVGALINISDSSGHFFTYKVKEKFIVSPKDLSVLKQDKTKHILTLQTSYPVGTALRRYIVVSELVQ